MAHLEPTAEWVSLAILHRQDVQHYLPCDGHHMARKLFDLIIKAEPANHRALAGRAVTYQMAEKWPTGLEIALKAIDEADYLTHLEYADMLVSYCASKKAPDNCKELHQTAAKHYKLLLNLEPENPEGKLGLGITLSILDEKLEDALRYVTDAYELVPQWPSINYWRGHLHFQLGDHELAATYLLRASNWTHDESLLEKISADMSVIDPSYGSLDEKHWKDGKDQKDD